MARQRSAAQQLVRHFSAAGRPIYLVDQQRVIVYCNAACAAWAGVPEADLIGQTCVYGAPADKSSTDKAPAAAVAAARLAPPPGALEGAIGRGSVSAIDAAGAPVFRQAEFLPLTVGATAVAFSVEGPTPAEAAFLETDGTALPAGLLVLLAAANLATPVTTPVTAASDAEEPTPDALHAALVKWRHRLAGRYRLERMLGGSPAAARVRAQVTLAAAAPANVFVFGPPGSGRQHVAKAIHYRRPAESTGVLVPVACGALDTELMVSTLMALGRSPAGEPDRWRTVLLENVDALSLDAQAAILPHIAALGSWRLIATAAGGPAELVAAGKLRADLAARLATLVVELVPLAERIEDLPLLAQLFLEAINALSERQLAGFTPEALDQLAAYPWPGNLDELAEVVRQAHERGTEAMVGTRDLPRQIFLAAEAAQRPQRRDEPIDLEKVLAGIETELIERALERAKGNKSRAAQLLGLTRPRLYRRLVQLGLEEDRDSFIPDDES